MTSTSLGEGSLSIASSKKLIEQLNTLGWEHMQLLCKLMGSNPETINYILLDC